MITKIEETTALILAGEGYQLTIAPEAEARKRELLTAAAAVTTVTTNDESADAQVHSRRLAQMRIEIEKSRKLVKEPVNRIGKLIDSTAKNFLDSLEAEEKRITRLVGDHAAEVARIKRIAEEEERKAFEAARATREAAEESGRIADVIAHKQAVAEKLAASSAVAETKVAEGVRFAWDFEVEDIDMLHACDRTLVEVTPKRAAILAAIKAVEDQNIDPVGFFALQGVRAFRKPVVSSR